jgi:hypothetical protein
MIWVGWLNIAKQVGVHILGPVAFTQVRSWEYNTYPHFSHIILDAFTVNPVFYVHHIVDVVCNSSGALERVLGMDPVDEVLDFYLPL